MIGTLDDMIHDANTVTDFTIDGQCSNCGGCCADFLPVSKDDIRRIRRYIKSHNVKEQRNNVVNVGFDFTCPFRDNAKRICTIYSVRPGICREFKCDQSPERLAENKEYFHRRYDLVSMRQEFFGHTDNQDLLNQLRGMFRSYGIMTELEARKSQC